MRKLTTILTFCFSFCLYGQNPKKIIQIPGNPSGNSFFSWPCNGLQFYPDYDPSTSTTQIWRTDGTATGTFPVTNFIPGNGIVHTSTQNSAVLGNIFYFSYNRFATQKEELWKTDGTVNGTAQVNISPLTTTGGLIMANSTHIFITTYFPYEDLYSVDNSGQVTFLSRLKVGGYYNSLNQGGAAIFRDKLVVTQTRFDGQGNPINLQDFFITDGTPAGSYTQSASLPVVPTQMTPCGNNFLLMLLPNYPYPNNSLAKLPGISNGGIGNLEVFYTGSGGDDLKNYKYHYSSWDHIFGLQTFNGSATVGNTIFLSGYSDNQGWELWRTDGTASGTILVKDIYPGIGSGFDPWSGFVINGKFVFPGYTNSPGTRIFYSDGTTQGTNFFPHIPISNSLDIRDVIFKNNKAFFRASDGSSNVIWQTDGGIANTLAITPQELPQDHNYSPFGILGSGKLVYKATYFDPQIPANIKFVTVINPDYKMWNGSADNNWNNPSNWEDNTVPVSTDNILIPGSAPNYPIINSTVDINSIWVNSYNHSVTNNNTLNISGDLSVTASNSLTGTGNVNFTGSNNHTLDAKGTISAPVTISGGDVLLGDKSNLHFINFQSDNKIFLGDYDLNMIQATGITGYNSNRFIVTNSKGRLQLPYIGAGQPSYSGVYPVGSSASSYTPVTINAATGTIAAWNVRVIDQAYSTYNLNYPEVGTSPANTSNAVNKTWFITNSSGNGGGANVTFQWNAADELPGFTRTNMKAGRYNNSWIYSPVSASTGNNPYTFTYNNVPGFSPFVLVSESSPLSCSTIQVSPVYCYGVNNGSATVTPSGGTAPYTYLWDNGETTATATGLTAGLHSVTVTDANQNTSTCSVNIMLAAPQLLASVSVTNVTCYGGSDGTASVTATGGAPPYTYLWSNLATTQSVSGLSVGAITVVVFDANGCNASTGNNITQPPPVYFYQDADVDGYGNPAVSVQACTAPSGYVADNTDCNDNNPNIHPGTAEVWNGIDDNCNGQIDEGVTNPRYRYVNDNSQTGDVYTSAIGNNANSGTPYAPYATIEYAISQANNGDTVFVDAGTYVTPNITIAKAITILGTNPNISVNDANNPLLYNFGRNTESVISGSTITIASSNINIEGFTFDPGAKSQFTGTSSSVDFNNILIARNRFFSNSNLPVITFTGRNISPLSTNTYFIMNNRFEKITGTGGFSVSVNFINIANVSGNVFTVANAAMVRIQNGLSVGFSGSVNNLTIAGNTFDRYNGTITTSRFGATLIDDNKVYDCQSGFNLSNSVTEPATITVQNNLISNVRSNAIQCLRNGGSNPSGINRSIIQDNVITHDGTGLSFGALIVPTAGSTVVNAETIVKRNVLTFTGNYSLWTTSSPLGIRPAGVFNSITIDSNEVNFTGTNLQPGAGGTIPSTGILIFSNSGSSTNSLPATAILNIWNNKISGFKQSVSFYNAQLSQYGGLLTPNIYINENSLTNDSVSLNFGNDQVAANINCNWFGTLNQDSMIMKIKTFYEGTSFFEPWLTTGTDTDSVVTGFQPVNGSCNGHRFEVNDIAGYIIDCNHPDGGMIEVEGSYGVAPYTYLWTSDTDPQFFATTARIENLPPATYKVVATDAVGNKDSTEVGIYEATPIAATVTKMNDVLCNGQNNGKAYITITAIDFLESISWSNGSTSDTAENLAPGRYYVTVTDGNGCTYLDSVDISEPPLLTITMTGTNATCNGSVTANVAGGTAPYTYLWNNGATTQTISNLPHGTYTVTITDANNCTVSGSYTVTGNSSINPTTQLVHVSCFGGSDGSIIITGAGGTAPHTYSLNGSAFQSSNVFSGLTAGTYLVTVKDAVGCVDFVTRTINQPAVLTVVLDSLRTACFNANTGRIYITASGGNSGKTYAWTGPNGYTSTAQDPNNIRAGIYYVIVTDSKGCTASLAVTLPEWPEVVITEAVTNVACRNDSTGAINITVMGGTNNGFTYSWTGPGPFTSTNEDINSLKAGNYHITVTDLGSNCLIQKIITVTQPASVVSLGTSKTNATGCNSLGTITATGSGGTPPYTYNLNGGTYQSANLFTGLYAGTYIVGVKDNNGCTKTVSVSITDNGNDEFESNNSKNQAKLITTGTVNQARIALATDVADWFKFTTSMAGDYTLTLTHPQNIFTYNMYPAGNNVPPLTPISTGANSKTYTLAANITYYISVTGGLSYECYQLSVINTNARGGEVITSEEPVKPVESLVDKMKVYVFPNPHQGNFALQIESPEEGPAVVQLITVDGKIIQTVNVTLFRGSSNRIQFSNIRDALLFYRIYKDGKVLSGKIIKQE